MVCHTSLAGKEVAELGRLAAMLGVQRSYRDAAGQLRFASPETLVAVCRALGAELERPEQAADARRAIEAERARAIVPPVTVAWGDAAPRLRVAGDRTDRIRILLRGESRDSEIVPQRIVATTTRSGGTTVTVTLPPDLPDGYSELEVEAGRAHGRTLLIRAPRRAEPFTGRQLGLFLPLHALRHDGDHGTGDFVALGELAEWAGGLGVRVLGTLPLLALALDEPFDCSPYAPLSRLFWNELFLDPTTLPELADPAASAAFATLQPRLAELRASDFIDTRAVAATLRQLLRPITAALAADTGARGDAFRASAAKPEAAAFASFCAYAARARRRWRDWPEPMRSGRIPPDAIDAADQQYHAAVQWLAEAQLAAAAARARGAGVELYFDLPVGTHPDGFDVWRAPDLFVADASAGAPPDALFAGGQDWGFPPLHPRRLRAQGYAHWRRILQVQMRHAGLLRIDHVIGLRRMFFVPHGATPADGAYVRCRSDELIAVLCVESRRHHCRLVGEDLGTVPPQTRRDLRRHGMLGMHVLQFAASAGEPAPRHAQASLNTHDTPTFRGFAGGRDLALLRELELLDDTSLRAGREQRAALLRELRRRTGARGHHGLLAACLAGLAASEAPLVLVALEDCWLEPEPQNVPGTGAERPNWRRRARLPLRAIRAEPRLTALLRALVAAREAPPR